MPSVSSNGGLRVTAIRKPFDPKAYAEVLVAAAISQVEHDDRGKAKPIDHRIGREGTR